MKKGLEKALTIELYAEVIEIDGIFSTSKHEDAAELLEEIEHREELQTSFGYSPGRLTVRDVLNLGIKLPMLGS